MKNNIKIKLVKKAYEGRPNIIDLLNDNKIDLVINTTEGLQSIEDSKGIRILALEKIFLTILLFQVHGQLHILWNIIMKNLSIISLQELNKLDHIN